MKNPIKIAKLNEEGVWALPKSQHKRSEEGKKYITKIEKLKKEIYPIFGDDLLFDEFDGAIRRIEELMELPESEIKESNNVVGAADDDEVYAFNLRMKDIRRIIVLIFGNVHNMDDIAFLKTINISVVTQPASQYDKGGEYIYVDVPNSFVIKIWEDGFVALENGLNVMFKFDNAVEVYKIITNRMK